MTTPPRPPDGPLDRPPDPALLPPNALWQPPPPPPHPDSLLRPPTPLPWAEPWEPSEPLTTPVKEPAPVDPRRRTARAPRVAAQRPPHSATPTPAAPRRRWRSRRALVIAIVVAVVLLPYARSIIDAIVGLVLRAVDSPSPGQP